MAQVSWSSQLVPGQSDTASISPTVARGLNLESQLLHLDISQTSTIEMGPSPYLVSPEAGSSGRSSPTGKFHRIVSSTKHAISLTRCMKGAISSMISSPWEKARRRARGLPFYENRVYPAWYRRYRLELPEDEQLLNQPYEEIEKRENDLILARYLGFSHPCLADVRPENVKKCEHLKRQLYRRKQREEDSSRKRERFLSMRVKPETDEAGVVKKRSSYEQWLSKKERKMVTSTATVMSDFMSRKVLVSADTKKALKHESKWQGLIKNELLHDLVLDARREHARTRFGTLISDLLLARLFCELLMKRIREPYTLYEKHSKALEDESVFDYTTFFNSIKIDPMAIKILCMPWKSRTVNHVNYVVRALQQVHCFVEMPPVFQSYIAKVGSFMRLPEKLTVIRQGQKAENFYIILSGSVTLWRFSGSTVYGGPSDMQYLKTYNRFQMFGTESVVDSNGRQYSAYAGPRCCLLGVAVDDYQDIAVDVEWNDLEPEHIMFARTTLYYNAFLTLDKNTMFVSGSCLHHYFAQGARITDSVQHSEWVYIVQTGTVVGINIVDDSSVIEVYADPSEFKQKPFSTILASSSTSLQERYKEALKEHRKSTRASKIESSTSLLGHDEQSRRWIEGHDEVWNYVTPDEAEILRKSFFKGSGSKVFESKESMMTPAPSATDNFNRSAMPEQAALSKNLRSKPSKTKNGGGLQTEVLDNRRSRRETRRENSQSTTVGRGSMSSADQESLRLQLNQRINRGSLVTKLNDHQGQGHITDEKQRRNSQRPKSDGSRRFTLSNKTRHGTKDQARMSADKLQDFSEEGLEWQMSTERLYENRNNSAAHFNPASPKHPRVRIQASLNDRPSQRHTQTPSKIDGQHESKRGSLRQYKMDKSNSKSSRQSFQENSGSEMFPPLRAKPKIRNSSVHQLHPPAAQSTRGSGGVSRGHGSRNSTLLPKPPMIVVDSFIDTLSSAAAGATRKSLKSSQSSRPDHSTLDLLDSSLTEDGTFGEDDFEPISKSFSTESDDSKRLKQTGHTERISKRVIRAMYTKGSLIGLDWIDFKDGKYREPSEDLCLISQGASVVMIRKRVFDTL